MKRRLLAGVLLVVLAIAGCTEETLKTPEISRPTETATAAIGIEARPGVYISNDLADFPFPISGYEVYIVGETHGNKEAKQLFQTYLQSLHRDAGVRDVVLEEHQAYEPDANEYILGKTDVLPEELCRRTDVLGLIREFNRGLPDDQKVTVHLVDVDSPLAVIYKHLTDLHTRLGANSASIQIPPLSEMETWGPKSTYDLIASLESAAADQPDALKELKTLRLSFKWYFGGNELDSNTKIMKTFVPLREDIITQNIQNLISRLDGRPILAYFGSWHAGKKIYETGPSASDVEPWAQRLNEAGIDVVSIAVQGISGKGYWRGETFGYDEISSRSQYEFEDGSFLPSLFDTFPDRGILYVDLSAIQNQEMKLPSGSLDIPPGQVYDGLVVFKEFTPMVNECRELK
jgi:hypothetical protein